MDKALVAISLLVVLGMFVIAGSAPQEAVFVGLACLFGIYARIAQAGRQHTEVMSKLDESLKSSEKMRANIKKLPLLTARETASSVESPTE